MNKIKQEWINNGEAWVSRDRYWVISRRADGRFNVYAFPEEPVLNSQRMGQLICIMNSLEEAQNICECTTVEF